MHFLFKNLIYFDSEKVADYFAVLKGEKQISIKNVKMKQDKSVNGKIPILSGQFSDSNEFEGEIINNFLIDCNEFEDALKKESNDSYFDFLECKVANDFETIPRTSIVRFEGELNIPEEFDMMDLINQFKPMLSSSMELQNPQQEELFKAIFQKESTKIPMFLESEVLENRIGFAKLNPNNLLYSLEQLEDYEGEDLTILAKVLSKKDISNGKPIVLFDIMKDLFSLNRALRREIDDSPMKGIQNIESDRNIVQLEILAIYM
ncbi:DUF6414 family protein [Lysinibacillus sp. RS11]|uniref:DUF6414 family protein n=1 Tax=Lysinibacillus sp. RS11 TaxID=3242682 RepID=UPI0035C7645F